MERMAKNFADDADILFPEVVPELSDRDVLTMTFMEGVKITDFEALERMGVERNAVATRLVQSFYKQLFVHRFFHADPHPGNFLVQKGDGGQAAARGARLRRHQRGQGRADRRPDGRHAGPVRRATATS